MGGRKFYIPFHPEHARELGNNNAELYYEYLRFCQGENGIVVKSVSQIQRELNMKRTTQELAKKLLEERGWITSGIVKKRSPTNMYKVEKWKS